MAELIAASAAKASAKVGVGAASRATQSHDVQRSLIPIVHCIASSFEGEMLGSKMACFSQKWHLLLRKEFIHFEQTIN